MPDDRILLMGPTPDRMAPEEALSMLRRIELPKLTRCVLTSAKFDTGKAAKTFNLEADYAPEPVQLRTLAGWSGSGNQTPEQLVDGLQLFALRSVLQRDGPFDLAILQRTPLDLADRWPTLAEEIGGKRTVDLGDGNLLLNFREPGGPALLDALWELHLTGAVYGFDDYSFGAALAAAAQAMALNG